MYLCHTTGAIHCIAASSDGQVMCSTAEDKSLKVFDVVNFGKSMNCGIFLNVAPLFGTNLTSDIQLYMYLVTLLWKVSGPHI